MPEYLIELYLSRGDSDAVERNAERARLAAEKLTREGTPVRFLSWIFVPEEETCLVLLQADAAEAACTAVRRAGLSFERLAEVVVAGEFPISTIRKEQS